MREREEEREREGERKRERGRNEESSSRGNRATAVENREERTFLGGAEQRLSREVSHPANQATHQF